MVKKVMEASEAVAYAVKLCKPAVIPVYPITPQTHIPEKIADYVYDGEFKTELIDVESEHSALSAAMGSSASGVRTFTATASQGMALMHEVVFAAAGMRLPIVMAVANRALSAPINIWNDQSDSIAERDSGWIQFYVETAQEAMDTIVMAFKIAEDHQVLAPVMVCLDGFVLSHMWEPVELLEQKDVDAYLPPYNPLYKLDPQNPMSFGPVSFPDTYMDIKKDQHEALKNSLTIISKANSDFKATFGRSYGDGIIETYNLENSQYAILAMGSVCGTIRTVIDSLAKQKKQVGLIKLKCFRPFPEEKIKSVTKDLKHIIVIDKDISLGQAGALFTEIKAALAGSKTTVTSLIAGLGGRDITPEHLTEAVEQIEATNDVKEEWLL